MLSPPRQGPTPANPIFLLPGTAKKYLFPIFYLTLYICGVTLRKSDHYESFEGKMGGNETRN